LRCEAWVETLRLERAWAAAVRFVDLLPDREEVVWAAADRLALDAECRARADFFVLDEDFKDFADVDADADAGSSSRAAAGRPSSSPQRRTIKGI